ncbi:MAG: hypothetical protein ACOX0Z_03060 [Candidatus Nanosyncoccaceae bacterium]
MNNESTPTTWRVYPNCTLTYCCCTPAACCHRPYRPPKPPPTPEEICLNNKLNRIRSLSLDVLQDLKTNVKDYGWRVAYATRDRWKSARYVLKIILEETRGDARLEVYQIVRTPNYKNYFVLYVWNYDRSSTEYYPEEIIGDMCNLLNRLIE